MERLSSSRGYSIIRKLKKYKICLQRIAEIVGKNAKLLKLSQNNECGHN